MADGDRPRRVKPGVGRNVPRTPDAVDIALDQADDDDVARALLTKHTELLKAQIASERLDHGAKHMAQAARLLIALAALLVAGGFIAMILSARADRSLVIEALATPPDLSARGLTGEVLAGNLADRLGEIDRSANSFRAPETMSTNWGNDIKIEIPSTGVSIGELDRFLRRKLGHQTVIGGSVFRTPEGLRMTVRTGALGTVEQTGKDADLEVMVRKAAEGVFEKTQPYRYSKYLEFSGRYPEAMAVARRDADTSDDPKERAWAWAQISNLLDHFGNDRAAVAAGKRALIEDPNNALALLNTSIAYSNLAQFRESNIYGDKASKLGASAEGGLSEIGRNTSLQNLATRPARIGDFGRALQLLNQLQGPVYVGTLQRKMAVRAGMLLAMHDISGSRAAAMPPPDTYFAAHFVQASGLVTPQHFAAVQMEDWATALKIDDAMLAVLDRAPEGKIVADNVRQRFALPLKAIDLAQLGRIDEARAIATPLPIECANCATAKMAVAAAARDYPAAYHWLGEVIRWGGDTPGVPTALGRVMLLQGQYARALMLADQALRSGPKFPDALKLRGDALRKLNRLDEAVDSYAAAAKGAPRWGRLQIDWGFAEMRRGNWDEARKHLAAAKGMDLNRADQLLLAKLQGVAAGR